MRAYFLRVVHQPGFVGSIDFPNPGMRFQTETRAREICNEMFAMFNRGSGLERQFAGPSMSVNDLVLIMHHRECWAFQCVARGWELLCVTLHSRTRVTQANLQLCLADSSEVNAVLDFKPMPSGEILPVKYHETVHTAANFSSEPCKRCSETDCICCPKCGHNDAADCACAVARAERAAERAAEKRS